jgi:hypothetical protein
MTSYSLQLSSVLPSLPVPVLWVGLLVVPSELVAELELRVEQPVRLAQPPQPPLP